MNVTVDKEKILELAKKCGVNNETLSEMFPDVFIDETLVNIEPFNVTSGSATLFIGQGCVPKKYRGKCIVLSNRYRWEVKQDWAYTFLIPHDDLSS